MNINIEWYQTFLVVARLQNYRKAAEELYCSQTSVRNQIKNLEDVLGILLFETNRQTIKLTEAGQQFYPIAKSAVETIESGIYTMQNAHSDYIVSIRVAASTYVASYLIPKFLPTFFEAAPHIDVSINVVDSGLAKEVEKGVFDIGINRELPASNKLFYKNICEGTIRLIVPNRPENTYLKKESDYFNKYRIFCGNHPVYWESLKPKMISLCPDAKFTSIASVHATISMIQSNQGVSYLPLYVLSSCPGVKALESNEIPAPTSFTYMMWAKENEAVKTFCDLFETYTRSEQT